MATKKCPNGHQYDESIYGANCPFCPQSTRVNPGTEAGFNFGGETRATGGFGDSANPTAGFEGETKPYSGFEDAGGGHTVIRRAGETAMGNDNRGRRLVGLFVSFSDKPNGEVYKIYEGRNIIGRSTNSDIAFPNDNNMSSTHLLILYVSNEGVAWAEDQRSSNGTYINGAFARGMVQLKAGDVIVIGGTKLLFYPVPEQF